MYMFVNGEEYMTEVFADNSIKDETYMRRAIALAKKGIGAVNPNPLVGAVIVKDGRVIGEGYHARYGELHAERDALKKVTEDPAGAEMYVTLEPCCHTGKQPPCVEAIVEAGIRKVYVGSDDPNALVAGKGITYLREHGIEVETHVLKDACDALNPVFFHYITTKTPYVVMKYAMTMDGKIASATGKSKWISGEASRARVQEMRNELTGIMVGIGTVLADDPMLTCRIEGGRNPVRIVWDSDLRIPEESNLVKTAEAIRTIVLHDEKLAYDEAIKETMEILRSRKVELIGLPTVERRIGGRQMLDPTVAMTRLGEAGVDGILLEGGGTLNEGLLSAGAVQEVRIFLAPKILGGRDALTPVEGAGFDSPDLAAAFTLIETERIGEDIFLRYVKKEV